jgi:DNA replicative helicase MCM subunit Mcm2 (Cdc46/Mcm family)
MREITSENLNKLVVKKTASKSQVGQDIMYVCSVCGNVEKEFALTSRNYKNCSRCGRMSVKSTLLSTLNWVDSDIQSPDYVGE